MVQYFLLIVGSVLFSFACQRSSGVGSDVGDSDTSTTSDGYPPTDSNEADTGSGIDSGSMDTQTLIDTEKSIAADTQTEPEHSSESESAGADTVLDTGLDTALLPEPAVNEWILIEGGSFEMGYDGTSPTTKPEHTVTVPSFEMQKTEVTVYQYRQCVDAGVCSAPHSEDDLDECRPYWGDNNWTMPEKRNYPVNCIDYTQARSYCEWLGGHLPSEAEWEYAASGGGQDIRYPWGNDAPSCENVAAGGGLESPEDCWSFEQPVCSKTMGNTVHGLCDMAGNYEEWTADRIDIFWGYDSAPVDGTARINDDYEYAVTRGGSYRTPGSYLTVYTRSYAEVAATDAVSITVRCARVLQQ